MFTKKNIDVEIFCGSKIALKMKGDYFVGESQRRLSGAWCASIYDNKILLEDDIEIIMSSEDVCLTPVSVEHTGFLLGSDHRGSRFSEQMFKGNILLQRKKEEIVIVNEVDIESFVTSILCNRFPKSTQIEYLKVQAVTLRSSSIALAMSDHKRVTTSVFKESDYCSIFDFRPQKLIENYSGVSKVCNHQAHDAVKGTKGMALVYHDSVSYIPQTLCCGGITENADAGLASVFDAELFNNIDLSINDHMEQWIYSASHSYCNVDAVSAMEDLTWGSKIDLSEAYRWKRNVEIVYFNALLRNKFDINIGNFQTMEIVERGASGIVKAVLVGGDACEVVLKQDDLDYLMVLLDLPSRSFVVEVNLEEEEPTLELNGAGMGVGQGICNVGAFAMAQQGKSMSDIFQHYLPEYMLEKQY
ncbi:SpoIID/LytB domain-containing protein [Saccharicrinis fermentans]|uniref:Stage II sporulation protein D n=1 Tax=Saccharicrinis fermentans DSM 9555 = JCM 21142 TaxID=869213 RepID=W7XVN1_9BACT|nr:SpoIID/LytB domain-containing protein [Saccharicrinis fermentans]GAF02220.1 stage II sporulation protein D [Saccharicrinis fermentans DSM 9555 = JCM 21142]